MNALDLLNSVTFSELMVLFGIIALILGGAGRLSVDRLLSRKALSERPNEHQQAV